MKKSISFVLTVLALILCLTSCSSNSVEDNSVPGVCKSGEDEYYAIKLNGSVSDYFTFVGPETQIAVSSTDGQTYMDSKGIVKYCSVTIGGTVVYMSNSSNRILYLPKGFPQGKIKNVASSFAMGFIDDFMTVEQAKEYIPELNKDSVSQSKEHSTNVEECIHDYAAATCIEKSTCRNCGEVKGDFAAHKYSTADCTTPARCQVCGETSGQALGHKYSEATCSSPKKCSRCGITEGDALGHELGDATCTAPQKCVRCSYKEGEALGHDYVDNKCSRCGTVDPDSIPVGLDTVHVIDSSRYEYSTSGFNDSFGYTYVQSHEYCKYSSSEEEYSIHYLNGKYSKFTGSIVSYENMDSDYVYSVSVYVDDELKYLKSGLKKTTAKVDFEIDISGGQQLRIKVDKVGGYNETRNCVAIVNAELTKEKE